MKEIHVHVYECICMYIIHVYVYVYICICIYVYMGRTPIKTRYCGKMLWKYLYSLTKWLLLKITRAFFYDFTCGLDYCHTLTLSHLHTCTILATQSSSTPQSGSPSMSSCQAASYFLRESIPLRGHSCFSSIARLKNSWKCSCCMAVLYVVYEAMVPTITDVGEVKLPLFLQHHQCFSNT